jgi:hypothetical protein
VCGVSGELNMSIMVTELLAKTLENSMKSVLIRCIEECGKRHGFDASEELRVLGLEKVVLIRKPMSKKSVSKDVSLKKVKVCKSSCPIPFSSSSVDLSVCNGIQYNRGLFTQCGKEQMSSSSFCKGCQSECDGSASGIPLCGTVQQRQSTGLYEFKDPKGRSPIRYVKVLEKCKLTKEQVLEEASKLNIVIDEEHFVMPNKCSVNKSSVVRGRPKKISGAVEADNVTDLFAKLTAAGAEEDVVEEESVEDSKPKKSKAMSDEEKAAKKQALEEERAAKKLEREAKLASDKALREAKRKAEIEEKQQQREAKIAADKALAQQQREAKRLQEKQEKAAKKEAKKDAKKPKNVSFAPAAPAPAPVAQAPAPVVPADPAPAPAPAPAKVTVTRFTFGDKQYLKSSSNILYNPETKEEVGIWDPETKTINDLPDEESDEEEEEDYEDEDN